jgi:hypothetical protein
MGGNAFEVPIPAMLRDDGDLGDSWICAFLRLSAAKLFFDHSNANWIFQLPALATKKDINRRKQKPKP